MKQILVNGFGLSTMCRLCLSRGVTVLDIFAFSSGFMDQVADVIMKCAPVQITRCDEMPNFICQSCYNQLEKSHQFQMQVVQADKTLRRYLQQLRTSNNQIKECSIQGPSEDPSIHNTKDTSMNCESSEIQDVFDILVDLKEEVPSNYTSAYQINEEISLKFEIKEEPIYDNSLNPTEGTDNSIEIVSAGDGSKTSCKIKEEPIDDNSLNPTECTDILIDTLSHGDDSIPTLRSHQRERTGEKPYQCDVCNKNFSYSTQLRKHKRVHNGEKSYQCDVCNKCFIESYALRGHQMVHTGEKPYPCNVCNKSFRLSSHLRRHQRVHTGERPYQCDVCNKCFIESSALNKHQRIHTGGKPYQCDVCIKSFRQITHLRTHQRLHTGVKPYQCEVCNKSFSYSTYLKSHQRVHTGVKPYQCDICNKCFCFSSHLRKHERVHQAV